MTTIHTPAGDAPARPPLSYDDYLRIVGLLTLAADHRKALGAIERSACKLLGDEEGGHVTDAVWGGLERDARELLELLNISVSEPE